MKRSCLFFLEKQMLRFRLHLGQVQSHSKRCMLQETQNHLPHVVYLELFVNINALVDDLQLKTWQLILHLSWCILSKAQCRFISFIKLPLSLNRPHCSNRMKTLFPVFVSNSDFDTLWGQKQAKANYFFLLFSSQAQRCLLILPWKVRGCPCLLPPWQL